jgi:predicted AlkP superfamily pyrophosphatase or phosphodiesterase
MKKSSVAYWLWSSILMLAVLLLGRAAFGQENAAPLLVIISVDGMKPEYVTAADAHGLKVPNLRKFLKEGAYADGVIGVIPTVTYPSHTTMVTGVLPATHGIWANTVFDPLRTNHDAWYWYAKDIRVPTLWDAADQAGRTTASLQWPATVGAKITWNIPEVWRPGTMEDAKLLHEVSTKGLMDEAAAEIGNYRGGIDTSPEADEMRGKYAVWILQKKHPGLLLLHLTALDHIEHETGVFSPEDLAVLERLDAIIGNVRAAAETVMPGHAAVAVVSDHGFVNYDQQLNLLPAFRGAKLFTVDEKGTITDWRAMPWVTGGSAAIVLKDPKDAPTIMEVRTLLTKIADDPASGINRILDAEELRNRGAYPNASFFVGLKPGWRTGHSLDGPVVSKVKPGGTHGELPFIVPLRSSFFVVGPNIPAGKKLGVIDMIDIAPTLAKEAGLPLPTAEGKPLLQ